MMRSVLVVTLIVVAVGCSAKQVGREQALANLKSQAEIMARAVMEQDNRRVADLTHPKLVEALGGHARYAARLEAMDAEFKQQGFGFTAVTVSDPTQMVESSGELYALVPFELRMAGPNRAVGTMSSALIGISADGGATWTFIGTNGVGSDRGKIKLILPNLPDQLEIPASQDAVWE